MAWGDMLDSGYVGAGAAGIGGLADLYAAINNAKAREQQQKIYGIMSDPGKLAAYTQGYAQPMTQAAIGSVRRDLGSQWAPMTGGATGGALNQFIADAMAKLETQRQQTASGQAIGALGGATGAISGASPLGNLGGIMKALMTLQQIRRGPQAPGITDFKGGSVEPTPYQNSTDYQPAVAGADWL